MNYDRGVVFECPYDDRDMVSLGWMRDMKGREILIAEDKLLGTRMIYDRWELGLEYK